MKPIHDSTTAAFVRTLRNLASYTRNLEEELDGDDSGGEGPALIDANSLLADYGDPCTVCDMEPHSPQCPLVNGG